jgi:hypothetical protein
MFSDEMFSDEKMLLLPACDTKRGRSSQPLFLLIDEALNCLYPVLRGLSLGDAA